MIEVIRLPVSPEADRVVAALRDLVVAHRVSVVTVGVAEAGGLPRIVEGRREVGPAEIGAYLDELAADVADSRQFQGDTCYLNPDGSVC